MNDLHLQADLFYNLWTPCMIVGALKKKRSDHTTSDYVLPANSINTINFASPDLDAEIR